MTANDIDGDLVKAVRALSEHTGWARIVQVRAWLCADYGDEDIDAAILRFARDPFGRVSPDEDQKNLSQLDRQLAVRIGDHDCHLMSWWGV